MKRIFFVALFSFIATITFAQNNPISWSFSSKKISDGEYELHLVASIQKGWHLYSQNQPKDAIAIPTTFKFSTNPLVQINGKIKEIGKLEKYKDEVLDVSANQYSNEVTFVQKVKVRGKAKTAVTGSLEFQTCDDKKCLPPKTVGFTIALK